LEIVRAFERRTHRKSTKSKRRGVVARGHSPGDARGVQAYLVSAKGLRSCTRFLEGKMCGGRKVAGIKDSPVESVGRRSLR